MEIGTVWASDEDPIRSRLKQGQISKAHYGWQEEVTLEEETHKAQELPERSGANVDTNKG